MYEKEHLLSELGEWRARERERAERLRGEVERLRKDFEVERMKQNRRGGMT